MAARRISLPEPVGVEPPVTKMVVTSGISWKLCATRSVTVRVSSRVEPGGSSRERVMRLWSAAGMKPVGRRVVDQMEAAKAMNPATSVRARQRRVMRRKLV